MLIILLIMAAGAGYFFINAGSGYIADKLVSAAEKAEARDNPALAERLYRRALSLNECDVRARTLLAGMYEAQDRDSAAEALLLKGIDVFPSGTELYMRLAALYVRMNRAEQAAQVLDAVNNPYVTISLSQKRPEVAPALPGGRYPLGTVFHLETSDGVRYYYELDGQWKLYTEPVPLNEGSQTVRVVAVSGDDIPSPVRSYHYTVLPKAQTVLSEIGIIRCPFCGETFRVP